MTEPKTYLDNNGYNIALRCLTAEQIKKIETDLTVAPIIKKATPDEIKAAEFPLYNYSENDKSIIVPRYYGISRFGEPEQVNFEEAEEIDLEFRKSLREKQQSVVDLCIDYMLKNGGGLLSVPCGFGKTVCALYIAKTLGLKTLVVVHKSFLLNQWIDRAVEFLNIRRENIGVIRQTKCDIAGKDLVIGVIHTMSKRPYSELYKQFGLVIFDEAHHVGAKYFSRTLMKTSSNYTLALTATPYRTDGLIKVMYWFTGGTIYRESKKMNCNVIVKSITHTSTDKNLFRNKLKWFKGEFVTNSQDMSYSLMEIGTRNKMMIDMITHIRRNYPERKMLILSDKISHLDYLKEGVDQLIQEDVDAGLLEEDDIYSCYYIGDTKPHDRQEAEERGDIIFSTYQMASEGLDIKHLNTLIFASPKKDVVQSAGRIMRTILQVGDVRPLIIDIRDDLDIFIKWSDDRNEYYRKCKYQIENYYMIDDKFVTGNRYYNIDTIEDDDRERHSGNIELHKLINNRNQEYHEWKNKILEFEDLCNKFENRHEIAKKEMIDRNTKIMGSESAKLIKKMRSQMFANGEQKETYDTHDTHDNHDNSDNETELGGKIDSDSEFLDDVKPESDFLKDIGIVEFEKKTDLRVLEDFEPYKISDILHVDRLTESDFTHNILKSANVDDKLDLDGDMQLGTMGDDAEDELMKYKGKDEQAKFREKLRKKRLF